MKKLINQYIFEPESGVVKFTEYPVSPTGLSIENLLLITNISSGTIIYNFGDPLFGGEVSGGNGIRLYNPIVTQMQSGDKLQIFYDEPLETMRTTAYNLKGSTASNYDVQTGQGTIINANQNRISWGITNYGTGDLYLKFGTGAALYTGVVDGVTGSITGGSFNIILNKGITDFDNNGGSFVDFEPRYTGAVSVAKYPGINVKYISWEMQY